MAGLELLIIVIFSKILRGTRNNNGIDRKNRNSNTNQGEEYVSKEGRFG